MTSFASLADNVPSSATTEQQAGSSTASEADAVLGQLFACALSACQSCRVRKPDQDVVAARANLRAARAPKPRIDLAPFHTHSDYQARTAYGRARALSYPETWAAIQSLETDLKAAAEALVEKHIACVRCADGDVLDASRMGPSTFVVTSPNAVMLHVWKSRQEARRFHESMRRLAQAKLDHLISSPLHTLLCALVAYQGACVTVAWLPPIYGDIIVPDKRSAAWAAVDVLRSALHLRRTSNLTLYFAADGRFYFFVGPATILHHEDPLEATFNFDSSVPSSGNGSSSSSDGVAAVVPRSRTVRYECLEGNPAAPLVTALPSAAHVLTRMRAATAGIVALFAVPDNERTVAIRNINTTTVSAYSKGAIAAEMHRHGVPLRDLALPLQELRNAPEYRGRDAQPWVEAAVTCLKSEMVARMLLAEIEAARCSAVAEMGDASFATPDIVRSLIREASSAVLSLFLGNASFFKDTLLPRIKRKYLACVPKLVEPFERKDVKLCLAPIMRFVAARTGFTLSSDNRVFQDYAAQTLSLSTAAMPYLARPENRAALSDAIEIAFPSKTPRMVRLRHHLRALLAAVATGDTQLHAAAFTAAQRALVAMGDPSQLELESATLDHVEASFEMLFDAAPANLCEREAMRLLQHHEVPASASASSAAAQQPGGNSYLANTPVANSALKKEHLHDTPHGTPHHSPIVVVVAFDEGSDCSETLHHTHNAMRPVASALARTLAATPFRTLDHLVSGIRAFTVADGLLGFNLGPKNQSAFLKISARLMEVGIGHIDFVVAAGSLQPSPLLLPCLRAVAATIRLAGHGRGASVLSAKGAQTLGHIACRCVLAAPEVLTGADTDAWHPKILRGLYEILASDLSTLFDRHTSSSSLTVSSSLAADGSGAVLRTSSRQHSGQRSPSDGSPFDRPLASPATPALAPLEPIAVGNMSPAMASLDTSTVTAKDYPSFGGGGASLVMPLPLVPSPKGGDRRGPHLTLPRGEKRTERIPELPEASYAGLLPLAAQLKPAAVAMMTSGEATAMVSFYLRFLVTAALEIKPACIAAAARVSAFKCRTGALDLTAVANITAVGVAGLLAAKKVTIAHQAAPPSPNAATAQASALQRSAEEAVTAALVQVSDLAATKRHSMLKDVVGQWTPVGLLLRLLLHEYPRMDFVMDAFTCFRSFLAAQATPALADEALLQACVCLRRVHRVKGRFQEALDLSVTEGRRRWLIAQTKDIGFRSVVRLQEAVLRDLHWFEFGAPHRQWCETMQEPDQRATIMREEMASATSLLIVKEATHRDVMLQWEANVRALIMTEAENSRQHAYLVSTVGVAALRMLDDDSKVRRGLELDEAVERKLCRLVVDETRARVSIAEDVFTVGFLVRMMPEWALTMFHWYFADFCHSAGEMLLAADAAFRERLGAEETRRRTTITQLCAMGPQAMRPQAVLVPTRIVPTASTPPPAPVGVTAPTTHPTNVADKNNNTASSPTHSNGVVGTSTPPPADNSHSVTPSTPGSPTVVQFGRRAGKDPTATASPIRAPVAARRRG